MYAISATSNESPATVHHLTLLILSDVFGITLGRTGGIVGVDVGVGVIIGVEVGVGVGVGGIYVFVTLTV